ncbi:MAG TPA: 3-oxoacyl-[acyl-carrier-protein] synthase III C-terminal domain-containing protein [Pirellulaceae bacterium]|jgi:3-oxoacyl-[acyl-carrier-protein] synthase III
MDAPHNTRVGISAIAAFEPPWILGNEWFGDTIPRKFVHHTGIESRPISLEDEVTMGLRAVRTLQREVGCDLSDCRAILFVSPSFVPLAVARRMLDPQRAEQERLRRAARQLSRRLGIPKCRVTGLNWFCCGYSRAMTLAFSRIIPRLSLADDQFVMIITASRISRITDYGCKQTAGLFGDMATATLIAPSRSCKYPVHFDVLYADAQKQPADRPFFDFHLRHNVPLPEANGGIGHAHERLVFSLDGMGIADIAPRAMSSAVDLAVRATGIPTDDVRFVVPHQAGSGIVRFTGMKLESLGIRGELINGLTQNVGNISSSSVPFALKKTWQRLSGIVACPTAAVGSPGAAEVSQGCVLLKATHLHEHSKQAAA